MLDQSLSEEQLSVSYQDWFQKHTHSLSPWGNYSLVENQDRNEIILFASKIQWWPHVEQSLAYGPHIQSTFAELGAIPLWQAKTYELSSPFGHSCPQFKVM